MDQETKEERGGERVIRFEKGEARADEDQPTANRVVSSPESNGGPTNTTGETSESDDDGEEEEVKMNDSLETLRDSSRNSSQNSLRTGTSNAKSGLRKQ